jgi:hypothetical protein
MSTASLRKIPNGDAIHTEGLLWLLLAQGHIVKCCSVDDPVSARVPYSGRNCFAAREVKFRPSRRNDVVARVILDEVRSELSCRAD